jgi:hypothetical protein
VGTWNTPTRSLLADHWKAGIVSEVNLLDALYQRASYQPPGMPEPLVAVTDYAEETMTDETHNLSA